MSEKVTHGGDEEPERYAFSLMVGGPLYRLLLRMRLSGSSRGFCNAGLW